MNNIAAKLMVVCYFSVISDFTQAGRQRRRRQILTTEHAQLTGNPILELSQPRSGREKLRFGVVVNMDSAVEGKKAKK